MDQKTQYWSEEEKEFYGALPQYPKKKMRYEPHERPDKRSVVHCAFNCPNGKKPILAYDGDKVYYFKNGTIHLLDDVIKNKKYWWKIILYSMRVFSDIKNTGAPGWRHNVRQYSTYIFNENNEVKKMVLYSVSAVVYRILELYDIVPKKS